MSAIARHPVSASFPLDQVPTPALLLDRDKLRRNCARMAALVQNKGVALRPHVKTHKSAEVWAEVRAAGGTQGITVSTLEEAEYFQTHGAQDILYAVGLAPAKVGRIAALAAQGAKITAIVDDPAVIPLLAEATLAHRLTLPLMIELDVDGHRAGVPPSSDRLLELARSIDRAEGLKLAGVMTHAGSSYSEVESDARNRAAQNEANLCVEAAQRIRASGIGCAIVSIGSTPTALADADLTGITELRAGVYAFFDLIMAGIGVARIDDIALSVLATVIGYNHEKGCLIIDAGWMALSRDRGTASQAIDQGYGLVCDLDGHPLSHMIVRECNQEHGIVGPRNLSAQIDLACYPIGSLLRILPNHACATAAQHGKYMVTENQQVIGTWQRTSGW